MPLCKASKNTDSHFNHNSFSSFNENKLFLYNTKQINTHVACRQTLVPYRASYCWNKHIDLSLLLLMRSGDWADCPFRIQSPFAFSSSSMTALRPGRFVCQLMLRGFHKVPLPFASPCLIPFITSSHPRLARRACRFHCYVLYVLPISPLSVCQLTKILESEPLGHELAVQCGFGSRSVTQSAAVN